VIDRIEYALQWLICWAIIDIKGHPMVSGLCTGILLPAPLVAAMILFQMLTGHWKP
jgi:hypothetical protein